MQDCLKCNAKGRVACPPCDSYGQIRCYISLTISWKANTSEHIVEKSSLPADLIRQVSGQVVYEEEGARIAPLLHFPDPTISLASAQLLLNHNRQWPDKKILAQVGISYSCVRVCLHPYVSLLLCYCCCYRQPRSHSRSRSRPVVVVVVVVVVVMMAAAAVVINQYKLTGRMVYINQINRYCLSKKSLTKRWLLYHYIINDSIVTDGAITMCLSR